MEYGPEKKNIESRGKQNERIRHRMEDVIAGA